MLTTLTLTLALTVHPHQVSAPAKGPIALHLQQTIAATAPAAPPFAVRRRGGDSLKDGAAIGAVVLGAATGLTIGYICHVFNDSDLNCWKPALLWTGIGAAAGAAAGAGVDALFQKRFAVRGTVKF